MAAGAVTPAGTLDRVARQLRDPDAAFLEFLQTVARRRTHQQGSPKVLGRLRRCTALAARFKAARHSAAGFLANRIGPGNEIFHAQ